MRWGKPFRLGACVIFFLLIFPFQAVATHHKRIKADALIDLSQGKLISSHRIDLTIKPASLTKLMTLYITFDALNKGMIKMDDLFTVSSFASSAPQCKLGLEEGAKVKVKDLLYGTAICSANDAARVIAENLAGSEEAFAKIMNATAKKLKMHKTRFANASGLTQKHHFSTVRDLSKLGIAVLKLKAYRHIFATQSFDFKGRTYKSTNLLLGELDGTYGLKTGFTNASGYNQITVCKRGNKDLMCIVIGEDSPQSRTTKMTAMLEKAFSSGTQKLALKKSFSSGAQKLALNKSAKKAGRRSATNRPYGLKTAR